MSVDYRYCQAQRKRGYASRDRARRASRKMGNRLHAYYCAACRGWHVASREKRER